MKPHVPCRFARPIDALALLATLFFATVPLAPARAQESALAHGVELGKGEPTEWLLPDGGGSLAPQREPCLTDAQREELKLQLEWNISVLLSTRRMHAPIPDGRPYVLPVRAVGTAAQVFDFHGISNYVDHDPAFPGSLLDYACGSRTYDNIGGYNHRGTDIFSSPLGWTWMDRDEVQVIALAPGTIVHKQDGEPDESCSPGGKRWNAVYVMHEDGKVAWYGHLKRFSLTAKSVGDRVRAGEFLGVMGSSGNSTGPHLHLELYDPTWKLLDPFAGPCNPTITSSLWQSQRPYDDSAINMLLVGDAALVLPPCPGRMITNEAAFLTRGSPGYFTAFYHDQNAGQVSRYNVRRPDGSVHKTWTHSSPVAHYPASYWWWSVFFGPAVPLGTWTFEVKYEGKTYSEPFEVR